MILILFASCKTTPFVDIKENENAYLIRNKNSIGEVFKENFGRARPRHIEEFNGKREFTGAFKISDQCERNCSFSSGHAAMGYFLTAIAYTTNLLYFNRIYLAGIVFGSLVGLSRIVMGGHFLSDVLASAFVVLFLDHVIFILWQMLIRNLMSMHYL